MKKIFRNCKSRRAFACLSAAAPSALMAMSEFAGDYYIDHGDIVFSRDETNTMVQQGTNGPVVDNETITITHNNSAVATDNTITADSSATDGQIVLDNVNIAAEDAAAMDVQGSASVELSGGHSLAGGKGGDEFFENDGNIHISSGEITAIGGEGPAGIGGGNHKNGGNITIGGNR